MSGPGRPGRDPLYPIADLKPGQSRFFEGNAKSIRASVWNRAKVLGWRMQSRPTDAGVLVERLA